MQINIIGSGLVCWRKEIVLVLQQERKRIKNNYTLGFYLVGPTLEGEVVFFLVPSVVSELKDRGGEHMIIGMQPGREGD